MSRKHIHWLNEQLPLLVSKGIVSAETASAIKAHYEQTETGSSRSMAMTVFSILGGILIAGGIILLMAHNWPQFGRSTRAMISFGLVILGQLPVGWILWRGEASTAKREGAGIFAQLTFGAGMALIAQTYHLSDDYPGFMLAWMLGTLPLVYLLQATGPALVYLAGITHWAWILHDWQHRVQPVYWWVWFGLLLPYAFIQMRRNPYHPRAILLMWGLAIALCTSIPLCLASGWRNLWMVIYSGLFVTLYLAGSFWQGQGTNLWQRPLTFIGGTGATILAYIATFGDVWDHMGWIEPYGGYLRPGWSGLHDVILAIVMTLSSIILMVTCWRRRQSFRLGLGVFPVFLALGYLLCGHSEVKTPESVFVILANLYFLAYGIMTLVEGFRGSKLGTVNYGMLVIMAWILARFFSSDLGFIIKGIVFILMGCGFLAVNLFLVRRKGGEKS